MKALPNAKEEQRLLSQMINAQTEYSQFSEGFRLGALLMCEVFTPASKPDAL